jgi:5-formyltetrahydrofolate cyclo-ligase
MIEAEKQRLRARIRQLSNRNHAADSSRITGVIRGLRHWESARSVLLFAPIPGEPDPSGLLSVSGEKSFLFPRIEGDDLGLYRWETECRWITGPYGILEPDPASWERRSPGDVDLALVPGMAFDPTGGRLGRGRGFYDRLLGDARFRGIKLGLAWEWQLLPTVPCGKTDIRMDLVVTEGKLHDPASVLDNPRERG